MRIAIIGTAGRKEDAPKMHPDLYSLMIRQVSDNLSDIFSKNPKEEVTLVSGGAAWADHVAVWTYLNDGRVGLELHLPAVYDMRFERYQEGSDFQNPGRVSNYYHKLFSKVIFDNEHETLAQIAGAIKAKAVVKTGGGFKERNIEVGKADIIWAFTWGEGAVPKEGGTKHTWDNSKAPIKIHYPLSKYK